MRRFRARLSGAVLVAALTAAVLLVPGRPDVATAAVTCGSTAMAIAQERLGNVFVAGETVGFGVQDAQGDQVTWSARDFWNREVAAGTTSVSGGEAAIDVEPGALGYFTLDVASYSGSTQTDCARTTFAVITPFTRPASSRYGVQTHFGRLGPNAYPLEVIPLMERLGVTFTRDSVRWEYVEQQPGVFSFDPSFDAYIDALDAASLQPMLVLGLYNSLYDNGDTPYTAAGLDAYGEYAERIVQRYGDKTIAVEVWNEPNGEGFTKGPAARDPGNYAAMAQHVHEAVKTVNPSMPVVIGATTGIDLPWLGDVFEAGGLDHADRVSAHHYPVHPTSDEENVGGLTDLVEAHAGGRHIPTWLTETGWQTAAPRDEGMVARDLPKLLALESIHGPTRISWFNLLDDADSGKFGLLRSAQDPLGRFVPKPAYVAYSVLNRQLSTAVPQAQTGVPGVRSYLFSRDGQPLRVIWAEDGNKVVRLSGSGPVTVTDMMGNATQYAAPPTIPVTNEPVYVEGNLTNMTVASTRFESESLPATVAAGTTRETFTDPSLSGGSGDKYNGTAPGSFVDYQVDVPTAGTYDIIGKVKEQESRGIYQLAVNGVDQGAPLDSYATQDSYRLAFFGRKHFTAAGTSSFRLTSTGQNPASTGHTLATDYLELVPAIPTGGLRFEAEGLPATVTAGTREQFAEPGLGADHGDKYTPTAIGDEITYLVEVPAAGTYDVVVRAKTLQDRGVYRLAIENGDQGPAFDSYRDGTFHQRFDLGRRPMNSPGVKRFEFRLVGQNDDSTGQILALDSIELIPVTS